MFMKKGQRKVLKCRNGIRDRDLKEELNLWMGRTSNRIVRKTVELEVMMRMIGL
jgi:hypothetical protein